MKKSLITFFAAAALLLSAFFTGCADVDGLHNQAAAEVTFKFVNFPESISGEYVVTGNWNGSTWPNDTSNITMTKGAGTSSAITIGVSNIQFTLVPKNSWVRPWYPTVTGNGSDSGKMQNFYIDGLNLDAGTITLLIDGSKYPATPEVQ